MGQTRWGCRFRRPGDVDQTNGTSAIGGATWTPSRPTPRRRKALAVAGPIVATLLALRRQDLAAAEPAHAAGV